MENLSSNIKAYWIWGLFPLNEKIFLNNLQNQVQNVLESPKFEAHITLSGPFIGIDKKFRNQLKIYSKEKSPVLLDLKGYEYKMETYESFFISIENSLKLKNLRNDINKIKEPKLIKDFKPHISLSYGNHEKKEKDFLISTLPRLRKELKISSLAIVEVDEKINLWNIENVYNLKK